MEKQVSPGALRATGARFVESPVSQPLALPQERRGRKPDRVQTIKAAQAWELRELLRRELRAGRIAEQRSPIRRIVPASGGPAFYAVKVIRFKDAPPRWRRVLVWSAPIGASLAGMGVLLWESRYVLLAAAGLALAGFMLWHLRALRSGSACRCPICGLTVHR